MIASIHWTPGDPRAAPEPPLLAGLPPAELVALLGRSAAQHVAPGELLFAEGEEPRGLLLVKEGAGEIFRAGRSRRRERLGEFEAGDVLAVASTLAGRRHLASARALTATELLLVPRAEARRLCRRHPEVALRLCRQMEIRTARLVRRLGWLAARTPGGPGAPRPLEMELSA